MPSMSMNASAPVFNSIGAGSAHKGSVNVAPLPIRTVPIGDTVPRPGPGQGANITSKKQNKKIANALQASKSSSNSRDGDAIIPPSKASGGRPEPSRAYLAASNAPPQLLPYPQHLLVIIDLNGTLLHRPSRKAPTRFVTRPFAQQFLQYCADTFTVVIWSSARDENVQNMCNTMLTDEMREKVVAIWARDKFGLTPEDYGLRVQCYKRLTRIWNDQTIARSHPSYEQGMRWDQTNTVLVDDSLEKGRSEPHSLIEIPEFLGNVNESGRILPQVHDYLNLLSMHSNVSACLRARPFRANLLPVGPP